MCVFVLRVRFQYSLAIIDQSEVQKRDKKAANKQHGGEQTKQRMRFGGPLSDRFKFFSTGVRRLLVLAVFPDKCGESNQFIDDVTSMMGFHELAQTYPSHRRIWTADIKATLEAQGQQTAASYCPCIYCVKSRCLFRTSERAELRTMDSNLLSFSMWKDEGESNLSKAKEFHNCTHPPVPALFQPTDVFLHKVPPPGLHIVLGIVNDGLKRLEALNSSIVGVFLASLNLARAKQWGGHIDGNQCRHILEHLNKLIELVVEWRDSMDPIEEIAIRDTDAIADEMLQIVDMLLSFKEVVHKCFGWALLPDYKQSIASFRATFEGIEPPRPVTPKVHIVFEHVADFCERESRGLCIGSEQAHETLHSFFSGVHAKHQVKDIHSPSYAPLLLQTVLELNAMSCIRIT